MSEPSSYAAQIAGRQVEFALRSSRRARRLTLTVRPGHAPEIVVPPRTSEREIKRLLREREQWLDAKLRWADSEQQRPKLFDTASGRICWLRGEPLSVVTGEGKAGRARQLGIEVLVNGPGETERSEALLRWQKRIARDQLAECCDREAQRLKLKFGRISVRDQRTRWGSCSPGGDLSFSWRLVVAPPPILEYVVVHELTHIRHHDHSQKFWDALTVAMPQWQESANWLRQHTLDLSSYEPTAK